MLLSVLLSAAWASPGYPSLVDSDLGMPCVPTCTLCHMNNSGGTGTVVSDFGLAMMDRGLTGGSNTDALATALDQMATDAVDSDGDGTIDVDELAEGNDPNPDGVAFCNLVTPVYGCFGGSSAAVFGAIGFGLLRRKR